MRPSRYRVPQGQVEERGVQDVLEAQPVPCTSTGARRRGYRREKVQERESTGGQVQEGEESTREKKVQEKKVQDAEADRRMRKEKEKCWVQRMFSERV